MKLTQKKTTTYKAITTTKQKSPCCNAIAKEEHLRKYPIGNIHTILYCSKCGIRIFFPRKNNTLKQTIKMKPLISNKPMTVEEAYHRKQTNFMQLITIQQALDYEVRGHWLPELIWFEWGQDLLGEYFAWKTKRKYKRYIKLKRK